MSQRTSSVGITIFTLLSVVFITLKLVGIEPVASWPWFSFNPFTASILMFVINWPIIIVLVGFSIPLIALIKDEIKKK